MRVLLVVMLVVVMMTACAKTNGDSQPPTAEQHNTAKTKPLQQTAPVTGGKKASAKARLTKMLDRAETLAEAGKSTEAYALLDKADDMGIDDPRINQIRGDVSAYSEGGDQVEVAASEMQKNKPLVETPTQLALQAFRALSANSADRYRALMVTGKDVEVCCNSTLTKIITKHRDVVEGAISKCRTGIEWSAAKLILDPNTNSRDNKRKKVKGCTCLVQRRDIEFKVKSGNRVLTVELDNPMMYTDLNGKRLLAVTPPECSVSEAPKEK